MAKISKRARDEAAFQQKMQGENESQVQTLWLSEGRSLADYKAGIDDLDSEVWEWRRAKGAAANAAERADWLRDHPDNPLPEHMCSLTNAESAAYDAWAARRQSQK